MEFRTSKPTSQAAEAPAEARRRSPSLSAPPVQVYLVAPQLECWGLQRLVQTAGACFDLIGCSDCLDEALPLLERRPPDVVVLDLDNGYGAKDIAHLYDTMRLKVLALASHGDAGFLHAALDAGARGFIYKREAPAMLLKGIEDVGAGEVFVSRSSAERLFVAAAQQAARPAGRAPDGSENRIASLTARELQTIAAVTADEAQPVKVIASNLCISEHTLRNHLTSIYSKLGVSGRLALYAYANQHALNRAAHTARSGRRM